jgi:hypothetical protein
MRWLDPVPSPKAGHCSSWHLVELLTQAHTGARFLLRLLPGAHPVGSAYKMARGASLALHSAVRRCVSLLVLRGRAYRHVLQAHVVLYIVLPSPPPSSCLPTGLMDDCLQRTLGRPHHSAQMSTYIHSLGPPDGGLISKGVRHRRDTLGATRCHR